MSDEPIPAATLIVVRDGPGGPPDLLMVERAEGMAFAAGALVFPGGRIDREDRELGERLGIEPAALAAIRETVEETAVPVGLTPLPDAATARELQDALAGGAPFEARLRDLGLAIDGSALTPFARWVPKFHAVRRFDTLFYVAAAPAGEWQPNAIPGECRGAFWISAADVLEREQPGLGRVIFQTLRSEVLLAQHPAIAAIRADADAHPIEPVTPWVEERDGEKFITIPAHLGFPVTRERLDGLWRG
jgi:8-oxo-dGTP pyrophosphatase MutT (NUDIX family)